MCLLALLHRAHPEGALVLAANRDEWLDRPASPMRVLEPGGPRILGGRDERSLGTWLAVNEHGVVAGLTNKPRLGARDPSRRSRGELPLVLARHRRAEDAVAAFVREVDGSSYEACWLLVGDRDSLHFVEVAETGVRARPLEPGVHVLENRPIDAPSAKAERVRAALAGLAHERDDDRLVSGLSDVLASHVLPDVAPTSAVSDGFTRPRELDAACVHAGPYGTRSATVMVLPWVARALPRVWFSDEPLCRSRLYSASDLWGATPVAAPPGT